VVSLGHVCMDVEHHYLPEMKLLRKFYFCTMKRKPFLNRPMASDQARQMSSRDGPASFHA
jgi:hypothetical protein